MSLIQWLLLNRYRDHTRLFAANTTTLALSSEHSKYLPELARYVIYFTAVQEVLIR
jgi:hypothetical protein